MEEDGEDILTSYIFPPLWKSWAGGKIMTIDLTNFKHIKSEDLEVGIGVTILDAIYNRYQIIKPQVLRG